MTLSSEGRVAVVTGGSRGIGRAVAVALAEQGADVAICYRTRADAAEVTACAIRGAGRRALAVACDVAATMTSPRSSSAWPASSDRSTSWSTTRAWSTACSCS
jgi:NAD(P)-dependent dehydrogenase (short-subunit alcohol dehydrogenase family)